MNGANNVAKAPKCCGKEAELKTFNTFQYHYCNECKNEVADKAAVSVKDAKIWYGDILPTSGLRGNSIYTISDNYSDSGLDNNIPLTPEILSEQEQAGLSATLDAFVNKVKADDLRQSLPAFPFYNAVTMYKLDRGIEAEEERQTVPEEDPVQMALWKAYRYSYLGID